MHSILLLHQTVWVGLVGFTWARWTNESSVSSISISLTSRTGSGNLSATTSDLPVVRSAWDCLISLSDWSHSGTYVTIGSSISTHAEEVWTYTDLHTTTTTLCDGVPRIVYPDENNRWSIVVNTTTLEKPQYFTRYKSTWSQPPPPCSISSDVYSSYCPQLVDIYKRSQSLYSSLYEAGEWSDIPFVWPKACPQTLGPVSSECWMMPQSAQLFFWSTAKPHDLCTKGPVNATTSELISGPVSISTDGTVLVSPSVYISFHNLTYRYTSGMLSTTIITNTFLSYDPDEISVVCGYRNMDGTTALNYADMLPPTPWSAYACMPRCINRKDSRCQPIDEVRTPFNPVLAIPPRMSLVVSALGHPRPEECAFRPPNAGVGGWWVRVPH